MSSSPLHPRQSRGTRPALSPGAATGGKRGKLNSYAHPDPCTTMRQRAQGIRDGVQEAEAILRATFEPAVEQLVLIAKETEALLKDIAIIEQRREDAK